VGCSCRRSVFVHGKHELPFVVKPADISAALFFELSGLKRVDVDDDGRLFWYYGELVRWEKPLVSVYMDLAAAPPEVDWRTVEEYWKELERWEAYLGNKVRFTKANSPEKADIYVQWAPPDSMWPQVGVARHTARYVDGSLKRVDIEIDAAWARYPGLWAHELAHAMGVMHVSDPSSVMYPILAGDQRSTLSPRESITCGSCTTCRRVSGWLAGCGSRPRGGRSRKPSKRSGPAASARASCGWRRICGRRKFLHGTFVPTLCPHRPNRLHLAGVRCLC
jgi:Matrixin.